MLLTKEAGHLPPFCSVERLANTRHAEAGRCVLASDWKFGLSGIFQPLRITSGGCLSAKETLPSPVA
jgi:hypothetical protein